MNDVKRLRLMNVAQVLIEQPTGIIEHRPTIVEISRRPRCSTIVMYDITADELLQSSDCLMPRAVGRIHHHGRTVVLDPMRFGGDLVTWRVMLASQMRGVESETTAVLIRPAVGDAIWIDRGFSDPPSDDEGKALHNRKRLAMLSLSLQMRLAAESMDPAAKNIYRQNCIALQDIINEINRRIGKAR